MRVVSRSMIAVGAMLLALVWSLAQAPSYFDGDARPLPTVPSTLETGPVQN